MSNVCTGRILNLVTSLRLGEGDRLPGERELAQHLKTSRNTVRESLISLAAQGQIEVRKRSGCYLISTTPPTPWHNLRADAENTLDALRAIAPHIAARAAERCQAEQFCRLETITARLSHQLVNRNVAQTVREYMSFLVVLASFAGNPYLELLMKELAGARDGLVPTATMDKTGLESFFALHVNLLQALQTHNAHRAQLLAAHELDAFAAILDFSPTPAKQERAS